MTGVDRAEIERRRKALDGQHVEWRPVNLADRFDALAARFADRPYVIGESTTMTYRDVADYSRRLAAGLLDLGVSPGDRVALILDNRVEFAALKLAVARVGAVAVPLNYSYRADELRAALHRSGACVLVTIDASLATNFLEVLDRVVPGWPAGVRSDELPLLRQIVLIDRGARDGALDLAGLADRGTPMAAVHTRQAAVDPDAVCDIVFTSGTTGHAMGAMLTHDMLLRSAYGSAYHRAFDDGWRVLFALPMYHVFGYVEGLLASMVVGGAVVPHRVFNPRSVLASIERDRVNEVLFVPTMTITVVEQAEKQRYDLASLQSVMSAAAPAPVWLWERVLASLGPSMLFTGYGQTEVSAATTLTQPADPVQVVAETVGTPKLGGVAGDPALDGRLARYRTLDPFSGEPLPEGAEGELAVTGPIVTRGYFDDVAATTYALRDGWLRTGDLGRIRPDGYLELTGRSRELFKVGGELVAPKEIEQLISGLPGVEQAYVAGVPDERYGEVAWAWVTPVEGGVLDERDILRHCRERLAPFKVPRGVQMMRADELPMTATGKVQKYRLVEQQARRN